MIHSKVKPAISGEIARGVFEKALTARFVEEALLSLFSEGKLYGTVHTCIGQELTGAVISEFLKHGDTIFSNHRCHGHFLARTGDIDGLIAELMGRETGVSGGLGGSQHLCKNGFYSNGLQGGIVPVAAGLALGHNLRGSDNVSVVFIGDGTLGEGAVYETLNIASKWNLPVLIVLEDNKYSQSTSQDETLSGDIHARATAFGIESAHGDTWHWEDLYETSRGLIEAMRADRRPRFLHIETYRLKAHSKGDDTRPREVVEPFEEVDPLNILLADSTAEEKAWIDTIHARVASAIKKADSAPFARLPAPALAAHSPGWRPAQMPDNTRVVTALNAEFNDLMGAHPEIFMLGEDIMSPYGGAFKVTKGLSDAYPGRVRNTPISEAAIAGIGVGLGLTNYRPVVEIMFGDFIGLAFDQIVNHAAKFQQMYNQQVQCQVTIRTPMGGGRGYGPTHSQTLDRHFLGVPGLLVVAMNSLTHPGQLYRPLLAKGSGPNLVIENKLLYSSYLMADAPTGFQLLHSEDTFPTAWLRPEAHRVDVTLLGYGGTAELLVEACERLFEEHDLVAQVICPMQIYPFSVANIIDRLKDAPALVIVEEGQGFAGFGAEVVAQLAEHGLLKDIDVRRVSPPAFCIPSSGPLEKEVLPDVDGIIETILEMKIA